MSETTPGEVTRLLQDWSSGREEALDQLVPLIHEELSSIASALLRRERPDHTLETSALVNEAYLRLVDLDQASSKNRAQFFGLATRILRNVLVDHARNRLAAKRGGGPSLSLNEALAVSIDRPAELVTLDDALKALDALYPQQARIVELRQFGGLTYEEISEAMGISVATANRGWRMARAWLYRQLAPGEPA
jgi:RNA polymerase sigma factor (TIGR02999 family)